MFENTSIQWLWNCPHCGQTVSLPNAIALDLTERSGACRECRLKETLNRVDLMTYVAIVDFVERNS